jgi:hypothetical protein
MSAGYLYGWDDVNKKWVKIVVDTDGKVVVSPS